MQELAVQEVAPCELEKPITKQRTTEQKGNKIRRSQTSYFKVQPSLARETRGYERGKKEGGGTKGG